MAGHIVSRGIVTKSVSSVLSDHAVLLFLTTHKTICRLNRRNQNEEVADITLCRRVCAAVMFVAAPQSAQADQYWNGYWQWYNNDYRPYYDNWNRRHHRDYGRNGRRGWNDRDYSGYRGGYYNDYYDGYYYGRRRYRDGGHIRIGPLHLDWNQTRMPLKPANNRLGS